MSGNRGIVNGIRREMVDDRPCDLDNHKACLFFHYLNWCDLVSLLQRGYNWVVSTVDICTDENSHHATNVSEDTDVRTSETTSGTAS